MAAVEITISGVLYDKYNRTQQNVVLIGEAMLTGLGVGGGPMPPGPGGGSGSPPGIWGGSNEPFPTPPIYFPPSGGKPPGIWGGGNEPFPTPPIELPPNLPPDTGGDNPKPIDWRVAWTPQTGWIVVGVPNIPHPVPSR